MTVDGRVGLVVVTYHRVADALAIARGAITTHRLDPADVCVVVNGSDPDDEPLLTSAEALGLRLERLPNPGYAAAVNTGVRALGPRCDFVLVATHDVELAAGAIAALAQAMADTPDAGVVAPLIVDGRDPRRIWSAGGARTRLRRLPRHLLHGEPLEILETGGPGPDLAPVEWVDGALYLIRTAAFEAIGGLEEGYFLYIEDVDLGYDLRSHGWKVYCARSIRGVQSPGGAYDVYLSTRNMLLLLRAEGAWLALVLWVLQNVVSLICTGWLRRHPVLRQSQRARGLVDGLRRRPVPDLSVRRAVAR